MRPILTCLALALLGALIGGCASGPSKPTEVFNGAWKQNECVKIADNRERYACLASAGGLPSSP